MSINNIQHFIKEKAEQFGAKTESEYNKPYVERNNTSRDALKDNGAYFGFIHSEEETTGAYHDFSLTIFPSEQQKAWLVCLGIGLNGFKNDYELATFPGLRRLFSKLVDDRGYCKSDFSDIETGLPKAITANSDLQHIKNTIKTYTKVIPVCQIVDDPESDKGRKIIAAFVAGYAKIRDWPSNKQHRKAISEALDAVSQVESIDQFKEVKSLLLQRKYVVLEGPPGTGKTRMAKEIAKDMAATTFFTQFHAETSFSDFIYGIRPNTKGDALIYKEVLGVFTIALDRANRNPNERVVLIIDEINRANLSNVLGPVFYLFEHKMESSSIEIEICPGTKITQMPNNFFVVATMNTADRSLAVVDFALRRRFAWYILRPTRIDSPEFFGDDFAHIEQIFDWYASSNELSIQPGQGYFLAESDDEMKNRIRYELLPLIREYLLEGFLKNAKEEFNNFFLSRINQPLIE